MSDGLQSTGTSRRTALKAGIATGVGVVAWSAPTITSLGGTPAYALGCTFVQVFSVTGGCRNTTQQTGCTGKFSFQPLQDAPAGFAFQTNVGSNVCCENGGTAILTIPADLTCRAVFAAYPKNAPNCKEDFGAYNSNTTTSVGTSLSIPLTCLGLVNGGPQVSSIFYSITVTCNSIGAPDNCLPPATR